MAYPPSVNVISQLIFRIREDKIPAHEMGVALAALIYLRWADFQESEQEAIAAFDDVEYEPVLPVLLHWRTWHMFSPKEVHELFRGRLPQMLEGLNNSRYNHLATHLHRIASAVRLLGQLSPSSLDVMIRWLADQPFETQSNRRALLDVFDSLLQMLLANNQYANNRFFGEFHTPAHITRLLIEIASPNSGESVYDPCFGTSGFLTAAYDYVTGKKSNGFNRNGDPLLRIAGVEINSNAYLIGLTRLVLAGVDDPQLEMGNSLERLPFSNPQRDGFDLVILNPPWGGRQHPSGLDHFPVRTSDSTGLFIQHSLSQLRPQGRAVIIVPEGFLFRGGAEQRLRRMLLEQHAVEAVVSLPTAAFMPYTSIKASILVLKRGGQTKQIRMLNADSYFKKGKGRQPATISDDKVLQLAEDLRSLQATENSWDVDIAALAEAEWDFSPRRRDKAGLSGVLDALRSKVEVQLLRECCNIVVGRAVKSTDLIDNIVNKDWVNILIPYVRIKDVQRGQATKGSSWLSPEAASSVEANWKLRAGDVLLSKSGTIGKTGVVRNGAVGAIAASGLFVIRPDQDRIDPYFLLAYFESSECRAWFASKARGATIQNLSKNVLDELPVPVPPLQMQHRVAEEYRDNKVDALTFLSKLMTEGESDPIVEWLDKFYTNFPAITDSFNDPRDLTLLDRLSDEVRSIRNATAHDRFGRGDAHLVAWLLKFNEALAGLRGVKSIPRGSGLLSVLQESTRQMDNVMQMVRGQQREEHMAQTLTKLVQEWLVMVSSALLNDVKLILSTETGSLRAGEMLDISLQVDNQGPLPLREVLITTSPDFGHGEFNFLAENSKIAVNLSGVGPKVTGTFTIVADWSALTLDGQRVTGSRELAFEIREAITLSAEPVIDMGGSPYVCGDPVKPDRNDVFFGREELLDQIRRQIMLSGNVVLLEGNRRAGKSSILRHLEGIEAVPGWLGVYCSLQGTEGSREGAGVPTVEVFRGIAISIATSLQRLGAETPLPDGSILPPGKRLGITDACIAGIKETSPFSYFREYIEIVLETLAQKKLGLLLMLDEFDKLQEGIDSGITSPQVPENIRFLVQTYPHFSAILTGSRRLKRLREEYWSALFGLGTRFGVTSLPPDSAGHLVTEPVKGRLTYSKEAVDRAITLTDRQPYLLQCLCNRIFDMAAQLKTRSITLDLVERAGDALVEDNEHFASLWDYAGSDRRRFILALCQREGKSPDSFRLGVIQEQLVNCGIEVEDERIIADLEFLRELELIDLVGESYVLSISLMGTWIERQQDFAVLMSKARSETEDLHE
ncbi:MAG: N-6 DNA methylase [Nitrospirae bacterium]|nr:N-6 DNA methylase [Nitrospirota bacterium]